MNDAPAAAQEPLLRTLAAAGACFLPLACRVDEKRCGVRALR